jgi:hypothetical protein
VFVSNNSLAAVAAAHSVDPVRWRKAFSAVLDRIEPRFARHEPLGHAAALMLGLRARWVTGHGCEELEHRKPWQSPPLMAWVVSG